jgi:uncharacterized membrane protein
MVSRAALEFILLALAWAGAVAVRPWRLLQPVDGQVRLATPLLATLTLLPWIWALPGLSALPIALRWSGAPLAVLMLGWPFAVPVLTVAGLSTMLTAGNSFGHALSLTVWSGIVPATLVLVLGHAVRKGLGPHPVAYLLGRAFFVPLLALAACGWASATMGPGLQGVTADLQRIAIFLLAMGEASWSCAIVSLLVAYRPHWLATWSPAMYLGRPARARAVVRRR